MKRTLAFSLIVGLILATPAIAGATAKPPTTAQLRSEFLSAVKPLNAAETTWDRSVNALPSSAPFSALEPIDSPFSNALLTAAGKLSRLGATGKIATDIKALDAAYTRCAGYLEVAFVQSTYSSGAWVRDITAAAKAKVTADHARCAKPSAYRCHRAICRERHRLESSSCARAGGDDAEAGQPRRGHPPVRPVSRGPVIFDDRTRAPARGSPREQRTAPVETTIANLAVILDKPRPRTS